MLDTSREAAEAQAAAYRRLGGARTLLMACEMSDVVRQLAVTRIKSQHPGFSDEQVLRQLVDELHGIGPHS